MEYLIVNSEVIEELKKELIKVREEAKKTIQQLEDLNESCSKALDAKTRLIEWLIERLIKKDNSKGDPIYIPYPVYPAPQPYTPSFPYNPFYTGDPLPGQYPTISCTTCNSTFS